MRTKSSIRNLAAAVIGQSAGIIISFISRKIFIDVLGTEYLGIDGLFTNILTMLSLVELGIGPAIIYCLYKPLAEKNEEKVSILMHLFQRTYTVIGRFICGFGIITSFFLNAFLKDPPEVSHLQIIFLMFVANTAASYFFSFKRSLIIADQKRYIATIYRYAAFFILNAGQCAVLLLTHNYLLFLSLQLLATVTENILVSRKADQMYPYLKENRNTVLDGETRASIIKNTKAMFFHRLGGMFVNSTDNLIISRMIGIHFVGIYSNYELVLNALSKVIYQFFDAFTASIGNMGATESSEKSERIFFVLFFMNAWIFGVSGICLWVLFNPFIQISFGENMIFEKAVVASIVVKYYLSGMRRAVLTYRDAYGLYWQDRFKPLFEIVINLIVSVMLVVRIGVAGVFWGTVASTLLTCFWIEPCVLFRYAFHKAAGKYFLYFIQYTAVIVGVGWMTDRLCRWVSFPGLAGFAVMSLVCFIIPNLFFLAVFFRKEEFRYIIHAGAAVIGGRKK